jgi:hypothetical protein
MYIDMRADLAPKDTPKAFYAIQLNLLEGLKADTMTTAIEGLVQLQRQVCGEICLTTGDKRQGHDIVRLWCGGIRWAGIQPPVGNLPEPQTRRLVGWTAQEH